MHFKICIVDDDNMVVFIHKQMMSKTNFCNAPLSFANGKLMLDFLHENNREDLVLLILLDINMPVMNGWELLDAINGEDLKPVLHIAMVTSSIDVVDKQKARTYKQVFTFIEKPISVASLDLLKTHELVREYFNQ